MKPLFRMPKPLSRILLLLSLLALLPALACGATTHGSGGGTRTSGPAGVARSADSRMPAIPAAQLPVEARRTLRLIDAGGPFPYRKDGTVFANREHRLPAEPYGYYREYTVPTPGSPDRGARRIIAGKNGERYYTDDHYRTFRRVIE